ncbi:hypothetical protein I5E68_11005 [Novosphingobium sp. YJ-S2-02]|uniref:Uncharacterized protein n=2 Tax=Novosphingobium aureum TaxID=2792964 RepID=A0A931HCK7_9SPHN|nr:hypothetical protein [Novosphingobium aureum]
MMEPAVSGQPSPRAFLRVAGASIARHQLGIALALDCQRIVCLARDMSPDMIAFQHACEQAGRQFNLVTAASQLSGLITANDEIFLFSDGLFADQEGAARLLDSARGQVLVQPIEGAQAAGFERIDINRASAGLARLPGELVERLRELPADYDTVSALVRIALQSGLLMTEVPSHLRSPSSWRLVHNEHEALEIEGEWLRTNTQSNGTGLVGQAIGRWAALTFGASLLHAGNASNVLSISILVDCIAAFLLGWLGLAWAGFLCAGAGAVMVDMHRRLRAAERRSLGESKPAVARADVLGWLLDAVLAGLCLWATPRLQHEDLLSWIFAPAMLFLLLNLLVRQIDVRHASWLEDRVLLSVLLAGAVLFGQVDGLVQFAGLGLVGLALLMPRRCRS